MHQCRKVSIEHRVSLRVFSFLFDATLVEDSRLSMIFLNLISCSAVTRNGPLILKLILQIMKFCVERLVILAWPRKMVLLNIIIEIEIAGLPHT